jgi:hypothetical protein
LNISTRSAARTGRYAVTGGFIIAGEVNRTVRSGGDVTGTRPGEEYVLTAPLQSQRDFADPGVVFYGLAAMANRSIRF